MIKHYIRLELKNSGIQTSINARKGESGAHRLIFFLTDDGASVDMSKIGSVRLKALKADGTKVFNDCTVKSDRAEVNLTDVALSCPGTVRCELLLTGEGLVAATPKFTINVEDRVFEDDELETMLESIDQSTTAELLLQGGFRHEWDGDELIITSANGTTRHSLAAFSPTIEVAGTVNGHKIIITDVNGSKSFEVLNGSGGGGGAVIIPDDSLSELSENAVQNKAVSKAINEMRSTLSEQENTMIRMGTAMDELGTSIEEVSQSCELQMMSHLSESNPHGITAKTVSALPALEDAETGCCYRLVNGVQEWYNPPLIAGVEYRTPERFNGKPVFTKLIVANADDDLTCPIGTVIQYGETLDVIRSSIAFKGRNGATLGDIGFSSGTLPIDTGSAMNVSVAVGHNSVIVMSAGGIGGSTSASDITLYCHIWYVR